ncbi:MAG: hypothetical protein GC146_01575 [Limimaricola sp.]|uniref:hypothetical protein n=1 Tax=Limimaricola sp. TaxID=2211665 RepID=UPI001D96F960|nr:hypothetical protein [Limimaricola sp.]MBI1415888.1 hypothetical protein [Limimaricola sp.]
MSDLIQTHLHLGAHKTATTHLQKLMHANRAALVEAGVRYYGPEFLRRPRRSIGTSFGINPDAVHRNGRSPLEQLDFLAKGDRLVVLSDENFAGPLHDGAGNVMVPLYEGAAARVAALAAALAPNPLHLFLAIRQPTTFLTSAYSQSLFGGVAIGAGGFRDLNPPDRLDWADLVARLAAVPGLAGLTVWRYEDYRAGLPSILEALLGPAAAVLPAPAAQPANQGLSVRAQKAVMEWAVHGVEGPLAQRARRRFPVTEDNPAFDLFEADGHEAAARAYADQVDRIRALPGVRLLEPATEDTAMAARQA